MSKEEAPSAAFQDQSPVISSQEESKPEWKISKRALLVFVNICVLTLMVAIDSTSIGVVLPDISKDLNSPAIEAFWAGTGFLLCATVFQPTFVSFSNIFGRRPLFLLAIGFFLIGSIVGGVCRNTAQLLVGRCIQGVGSGGIMAITEVLIADLVPLRQRGQYYGIMNGTWSIGSVCGPIVGGAFANANAWRWIFYINFPFIGIGVICVILFMKLNFVPTSLAEKLRRVDYVGTVIFVGSTTSFLIPLTWGGVMYDWSSWRTLVPLIIGIVGCIGFAAYEAYFAGVPIVPAALFKNRTTTASFISAVSSGLLVWCVVYYMPLYYEAVKEYSPVITGVAMFPLTFTVAPAGVFAGVLITIYGKYRWAIWSGWSISTLGFGILYLLKVDTSVVKWIFMNAVSGIGLGFIFPSVASAIQASVTRENVPMALAMFSFFRSLGQAIGVAIGGAIFQNQMLKNLQDYPSLAPHAQAYAADASGLVQVIRAMPYNQDKADLQQAYVDSLRIVWAVCCGLSGGTLLVSLLIKSYSIDQDQSTYQGVIEKNERDIDDASPAA